MNETVLRRARETVVTLLINFPDESQRIIDASVSKSILRIVNDKNCLCYFVQYLEQKSALPWIKFWLDAESFKSATEMCLNERTTGSASSTGRRTRRINRTNSSDGAVAVQKGSLTKSISFDCGIVSNSNGICDDASSMSLSLDEDCKTHNYRDIGHTVRDSGDGSSDANSMTNLSDICEQDSENGDNNAKCVTALSDDDDDLSTEKPSEVDESGRKSAIGAPSDDCESSRGGHHHIESHTTRLSPNFQSSLIMDAMRIFKKYLLNRDSPNYVDVPAMVLSRISLALCVRNEVSGKSNEKVDSAVDIDATAIQLNPSNDDPMSLSSPSVVFNIGSIFEEAQAFVLDYLDTTFTNAFLESSFYCRYCIEILSGDNLKITDILYNEAALFYFMEFLENENRRQYSDFWLAAMNFKRFLDEPSIPADLADSTSESAEISSQQAQNDALILYEKYFSLQATCPLHLSDRVRYQIEEKICSIDGNASIAHCFDLPLIIIERFLEQKYLDAFLKSQLFFKYLSELLQKIGVNKSNEADKSQPANLNGTKVVTQSKDYASAISSQNTLLAMESVKKRVPSHRIRSTSTSDMCIDARQLRDPDLLWRRNSTSNGLNFGRIDALGRYERDYDMTPFGERNTNGTNATPNGMDSGLVALQNTGNKIKQAVRKLVHLPEHHVQEEIAWQMAEMIVKDITNVTLHSNEVQK